MNQWLYKATPKRVELDPTRNLAVNDGFVCRSAYVRPKVRAALTRAVKFGDILHVYYVEKGIPTPIGTFEVIDSTEHPNPIWFGSRVLHTSLFQIIDQPFEQRLKSLPTGKGGLGYRPDPVLGTMVGWAIRALPPPYDPAKFPSRHTLVLR